VELGGQGQPGFLLRAHDERVVLARDLDEEEQLVTAQGQNDSVLGLVEDALDQLVPELEPRLLLLVGDEVVLLTRDLLQENELTAVEVQGHATGFDHR
jgi:hypothetical protein